MPEAILVPPFNSRGGALSAAVRARAFDMLLDGGRPVPVAELGAPAGRRLGDVQRVVGDLVAHGRMTVADDGAITGSLGLTVPPDRHLLVLPEGDRYTWCPLVNSSAIHVEPLNGLWKPGRPARPSASRRLRR
jgi:hypothetical protein